MCRQTAPPWFGSRNSAISGGLALDHGDLNGSPNPPHDPGASSDRFLVVTWGLVMDERMRGFVESIDVALNSRAAEMGSTDGALVRRKLSTVVRECGRSKATREFRQAMATAFGQAGIYTFPGLAEPSLMRQDWVRFSRVPFLAAEALFPSEEDLEKFIAQLLGAVDPFRDLRLIKRQQRIRNCRLDILAEERSAFGRGTLVVIELKKASGETAVRQVVRYMKAVRRSPQHEGRDVRGLVVTGRPDRLAAEEAARWSPEFQIDVLCCRFTLDKVSAIGDQPMEIR